MNEESEWLERARLNKSPILAIFLDLEDRERFPVEFQSMKEFEKFRKNIISESKIKFLKIFEIG